MKRVAVKIFHDEELWNNSKMNCEILRVGTLKLSTYTIKTHQFPVFVFLGGQLKAEAFHLFLQVHFLHLQLPAPLLLGLQGES